MNRHGPTPTPATAGNHEQRFDDDARALHADALANVSPRVRSRLQQARQAASLGAPAKPSRLWAWAGSTAVFALALGVGMQLQNAPVSSPGDILLTAKTTASATDQTLAAVEEVDIEISELLAALDENPDFYLWLAANDGALSAPTERYP